MATQKLTDAVCRQAVAALRQAKDMMHASQIIGVPYPTFRHRLREAKRRGFYREIPKEDPIVRRLQDVTAELRALEDHNKHLAKEVLSINKVKELIHGAPQKFRTPKWLVKSSRHGNTGVPTFFASDWHWDEVVDSAQVNYVNAYNRDIAVDRAKRFFTTGVELLTEYMARAKYDYCVLILGGDMLSGNIHEELRETNEHPIHVSLLSVVEHLIAGIDLLHKTFGKVVIYCVPGNHGRLTRKPAFKNKAYDNYDWLLYQMLKRHFVGDDDIVFDISDSTELLFKIYSTRYMLIHGDDFNGGSGIAGPFTPWMLGDHKKRKRQQALNDPYDILLMGHWHCYTPLKNIIVNGCLKGYDEYARSKNYDFEVPIQAVWVTHPEHGVTVHWPVYLEPKCKLFR